MTRQLPGSYPVLSANTPFPVAVRLLVIARSGKPLTALIFLDMFQVGHLTTVPVSRVHAVGQSDDRMIGERVTVNGTRIGRGIRDTRRNVVPAQLCPSVIEPGQPKWVFLATVA
jgi:hypothetical protein